MTPCELDMFGSSLWIRQPKESTKMTQATPLEIDSPKPGWLEIEFHAQNEFHMRCWLLHATQTNWLRNMRRKWVCHHGSDGPLVDDLAVKKKEHVHSKLLNYPRVQDIWWGRYKSTGKWPKETHFFFSALLALLPPQVKKTLTLPSDFIGFGRGLSTNLTSDMPWYAW